MNSYSVSDKIRYYSNLSKKGSIDTNGKPLSDFQRGVNFGKARMLSYCASKIKTKNVPLRKTKKLDLNERSYTDAELEVLFDNNKDIGID